MAKRALELEVMRGSAHAATFEAEADPDDVASLRDALAAWLDGEGWKPATWGQFRLLVRPVTDRFQLERAGWRWRIARIWWARHCTVLRDGEQWTVIDWRKPGKGPDAAIWVYVMPLESGEDDARIGWILLDALDPGLTPRETRRQWKAGHGAVAR